MFQQSQVSDQMGPLKRRSSSVPETTFIATTTILLILLLAAVVAFIVTFFRHIHRPEVASLSLTPSNSRGFSRNKTAQQQAPAQQRRPSNTRTYTGTTIPSPYIATHTSPLPTYRPSISPSSAPAQTLLPYSPNIPPASLAKPNSPDAVRRDALMAKLAAIPLTSDTTDDTAFEVPRREVMNQGYADWLARKLPPGADPTAAMLIGSDEGTTDAGGEEAGNVGYAALLARDEGSSRRDFGVWDGSEDLGGYEYSRYGGHTDGGRAWRRFGGREREGGVEEDEEPLTPRPLPVALKKIRSDPYRC